jgi:hypothetical protein
MRVISARAFLPNLRPKLVASSKPAAPPPTITILCFSAMTLSRLNKGIYVRRHYNESILATADFCYKHFTVAL